MEAWPRQAYSLLTWALWGHACDVAHVDCVLRTGSSAVVDHEKRTGRRMVQPEVELIGHSLTNVENSHKR